MSFSGKRMLVAFITCVVLITSVTMAQDVANLPYMNPSLTPEQRAADLVHRMTLEEKASQLVNQARAIPRLKVPAYDWWSEALHGFARVLVDGKAIAQEFGTHGVEAKVGRVHLEGAEGRAGRQLRKYGRRPASRPTDLGEGEQCAFAGTIAAARSADVVIAAVGITSELEGEEMPVNEPGFLGGDRTSIDLPAPEEALVEAVAAAGKPRWWC